MLKILLVVISFVAATANAAKPPPKKSEPRTVVMINDLNCHVSNGVVLTTLSRDSYGYTGNAIISAGYFGIWKKMASSFKTAAPGDTLQTITLADRQTSYDLKLVLDPTSEATQKTTGQMFSGARLVGAVSCSVTLSVRTYPGY